MAKGSFEGYRLGRHFKQQADQRNSRLLWEETAVFISENQEASVHMGNKKKNLFRSSIFVNVNKCKIGPLYIKAKMSAKNYSEARQVI